MSKKFICTVCGYVHEGDTAPEKCPLCGAPASKFIVKDEASAEKTFAAEHVLGIAKGVDAEEYFCRRMLRSRYVFGHGASGRA